MQDPHFFPLTEQQVYENKSALSQKLNFIKTVYDLASEEGWFADMFGISPLDASVLSYEIFLIQEKILGKEKIFEDLGSEYNETNDKGD